MPTSTNQPGGDAQPSALGQLWSQGTAPLVNFARTLMGNPSQPAAAAGTSPALSGQQALTTLPGPMQRMLDTTNPTVRSASPYQDAIASVREHDPSQIEINDPGRFAQDPRQVIAHEATHILQNNLPGPMQARIPADTTTGDPYNIDNVDSLRKMGKHLFDLPREQGAAVVQRYVTNQSNPAEQRRLQPWMDDMKTAPLSITMPTAPDAKRMNMNPRPPGLPQDVPEAMLQPRRKALQ
jgi:hypothetical protein